MYSRHQRHTVRQAARHAPTGLSIAVVDSDVLFRRTFAANAILAGHTVAVLADGKSLLMELFGALRPQVIVLDEAIARRDGCGLIHALQVAGFRQPLVLLRDRSANFHAEALERFAVILERTLAPNVILRRVAEAVEAETTTLTIGPLVLDKENGSAMWRGRHLQFTQHEIAIVAGLAERTGTVLAYPDLLRLTAAGAPPRPTIAMGLAQMAARTAGLAQMAARTAVQAIRAKFEAVDPAFAAIEHYTGLGYRWRAPGPGGNRVAASTTTTTGEQP